MAELADAHGSGPCSRKGVEVQVLSSAPRPHFPSQPGLSEAQVAPNNVQRPGKRHRGLLRRHAPEIPHFGAPSQCDFASGVDASGNALCNPFGASAQNGFSVFNKLGCNVCHTQSFTTQPSNVAGLSNRTFQPFSDFALHHMGSTLADGVTQGLAGPDQFRTAPLWGLGQRLFFLHDGRTSDLKQAILDHASAPGACFTTATSQIFSVTFPLNNNATALFTPAAASLSCGSEANDVIAQFKRLSSSDQQDLLNFLRSL